MQQLPPSQLDSINCHFFSRLYTLHLSRFKLCLIALLYVLSRLYALFWTLKLIIENPIIVSGENSDDDEHFVACKNNLQLCNLPLLIDTIIRHFHGYHLI